MTARERVDLLLDPGSWVEVDALVTHRCTDFGMAEQRVAGDGVVCGPRAAWTSAPSTFSRRISRCSAVRCPKTNARKICKVMDLAVENGAPGVWV